jgi:hypothetical protein
VDGDPDALRAARESVAAALGPEAAVDGVAVASNFERMVRIADATGIPLDAPVAALSEDLRRDLGLDGFAAAANTPPVTHLQRWLGRAVRPLMPWLLKRFRRRLEKAAQRPPAG